MLWALVHAYGCHGHWFMPMGAMGIGSCLWVLWALAHAYIGAQREGLGHGLWAWAVGMGVQGAPPRERELRVQDDQQGQPDWMAQ